MRLSLSKKLGNENSFQERIYYNFTERWKTKNDTKRINLFNAKNIYLVLRRNSSNSENKLYK